MKKKKKGKPIVIILSVLVILAVIGVLWILRGNANHGLTIKPGVLSIGVEVGYPPMEYLAEDGQTLIGFDIAMGRGIAAKLGLKAEFINTTWDGIFAGLYTGRYDAIMSSATMTQTRMESHNFSKPYIANTLAMVLRKDSKLNINSPEQCAGLNVAFQADTTSESYMDELFNKGIRYTARKYEKVMSCFDELNTGRADVVVVDLLVAYDYIAPTDSPFKIVWENHNPELFGIVMRKGNDALTKAIDKALEDMFNDGSMVKISKDIFGMDLVTEARNEW